MKRCSYPTSVRLLVLSLSFTLFGCQAQSSPATPTNNDPAAVRAPADLNTIHPADSLRARLVTGPVKLGAWHDEQRVAASIKLDAQRVARIGSAVTGRVDQILVQPGVAVERGTVLATLNSPELADTQLAYLKALSNRHLKAREAARARELVKNGVLSEAELQRRETDLEGAGFDVSALADRLRGLGMAAKAIDTLAKTRRIDSTAHLIASINGTVIARNIAPGQVLQATDDAFTIADLSHVWAVADVPEQSAAQLLVGQKVTIHIPALRAQNTREGDVIYISPTVNPDTRTIAVRSDVDNSDHLLKPNMLAVMLIRGAAQERPIIPVRAVVRENNADFVFVEQADGSFRLTPVTLGAERQQERPVVSGLNGGEIIVQDGAFHLNNERRRKELE
ncbi:MAG: efflux RND transporter periplasmic adaptor subunit [Halothiobacillus sp.]